MLNKVETHAKKQKRNKEDAQPFLSLDTPSYSTPNNNLKHSLAYIAARRAHSDTKVPTMFFI